MDQRPLQSAKVQFLLVALSVPITLRTKQHTSGKHSCEKSTDFYGSSQGDVSRQTKLSFREHKLVRWFA